MRILKYYLDNQLNSLDISHLPELQECYCYNTNISELDVSKNNKLIRLSCGKNNLSQINCSNLKDLEFLYVSENNLTALDIRQNLNLTELNCGGNMLTEGAFILT